MKLRYLLSKVYIPFKYNLFKLVPPKYYHILIKVFYMVEVHEFINIKNPKSINEKVQWLKLYSSKLELKQKLADKFEVRSWVESKIGAEYLIPILGVWDRIEDVNFDKLPNQFVLKSTHGCGCNYIVYDKNNINLKIIKKKFNTWRNINYSYYSGELHYRNIKQRIIAEKYIENSHNELSDYKVFCFNGKAKYIMYLTDRKSQLKMSFYDLDWNLQSFTYSYPKNNKKCNRPKYLNEMINLAERLSEPFDLVRVDFYILNDDSIKFGEMTFASAGGFCKWTPLKYNMTLGNLVDIDKEK